MRQLLVWPQAVSLTSLDLRDCWIDVTSLWVFVEKLTGLRSLYMCTHALRVAESAEEKDIHTFTALRRLCTLDLRNETAPFDQKGPQQHTKSVEELAPMVHGMRMTLTRLCVTACVLGEQTGGVAELVEPLGNLTELDLGMLECGRVLPEARRALVRVLAGLTRLRSLDVRSWGLATDAGEGVVVSRTIVLLSNLTRLPGLRKRVISLMQEDSMAPARTEVRSCGWLAQVDENGGSIFHYRPLSKGSQDMAALVEEVRELFTNGHDAQPEGSPTADSGSEGASAHNL